jgi:hypothetical protein
VCADVRFLGSYPRADRVEPTMRRGTADTDFEAAAKWLSHLRANPPNPLLRVDHVQGVYMSEDRSVAAPWDSLAP